MIKGNKRKKNKLRREHMFQKATMKISINSALKGSEITKLSLANYWKIQRELLRKL